MTSLHIQRKTKIVALEIGVGLVGTTATILMRRLAAHRNDVDVDSCLANVYRLNEISAN